MAIVKPLSIIEDELKKMAFDSGASVFVPIEPWKIVTAHWVRLKCQFGCKNYGTRLTCPPYSPSPEDTRKVLDEYTKAYLVRYDGLLGFDTYPPEALDKAMISLSMHVCDAIYKMERHAFLSGYYKAFSYGAHRCRKCDTCAIKDGVTTCRFPVDARPSLESAGIDVFKTAENAGMNTFVVQDRNIEKKEQLPTYTLLLLE
jgi:predicted metal-binding protein